jgi:hypothetical protein
MSKFTDPYFLIGAIDTTAIIVSTLYLNKKCNDVNIRCTESNEKVSNLQQYSSTCINSLVNTNKTLTSRITILEQKVDELIRRSGPVVIQPLTNDHVPISAKYASFIDDVVEEIPKVKEKTIKVNEIIEEEEKDDDIENLMLKNFDSP